MEKLLSGFVQVLNESFWLASIMALLAGVVASFSPCTLTSIPLIIGYVGGYSGGNRKKAFKTSLVFALGMIITLTALGALASLIGKFFAGIGGWWYIILGIFMIIMSLQLLNVINIMPNVCRVPSKQKGMFGAFLFGLLGGLFSSPCSTPALVAILAFAGSRENILQGVILLLLYSIGHSVLIIIAGTSVGFIQQLTDSEKTQKIGRILMKVLGIMILLLAFYLLYLGF